jgi:hypothetical protein
MMRISVTLFFVYLVSALAFTKLSPCRIRNERKSMKIDVAEDKSLLEIFVTSAGSSIIPIAGVTVFLTLLNNSIDKQIAAVDKQIAAERDGRKEQIAAVDKQIAAERDARKEQNIALERYLKEAIDRIEKSLRSRE